MDEQSGTSHSGNSPQGQGPVGQGNYAVKQGDCVDSIAVEHGFFWETLWNHPDNSELRAVRKEPNVLLAGDRILVPDIRVKEESGATDARHRFRRKGVPAKFKVTLLGPDDQPRANEPYRLEIDGNRIAGALDSDGSLEVPIPCNARRGVLYVGEPDEEERYEFQLGGLDPIDQISGIKSRLDNLGYDCGPTDNTIDDRLRDALAKFQQEQNLAVTGEIDQATRQKLDEMHT